MSGNIIRIQQGSYMQNHGYLWTLQSWKKVLGTVLLQYSYFSVISRFPLKTVQPFRKFLAVLPPPTLYKVETRKKFWIHASNIVCGVRGGVGPVWIGKRPRNATVPRLLSMNVVLSHVTIKKTRYCIVVLTYLADDQHLSNCFAAHVCSCDDVVLLTRIPSSYCFSRCQGYIFSASYKLFRCGVTNRYGGILNYLKTEPGEKALLHFLNQFWNVKGLEFCHPVTAKWFSIQILS